MALCRLVSRKIGTCLMNKISRGASLLPPTSRTIIMKPRPAPCPQNETQDERNMRIGRPQSPYLTILRVELPMILSGSHRITGVIIGGYAILLGFGTIILPDSIPHYIDMLAKLHVGQPIILAAKFLLAAPFVYHTCNGVRHLFWDMGLFLSRKGVYTSGYIMLTCFGLALGALLTL